MYVRLFCRIFLLATALFALGSARADEAQSRDEADLARATGLRRESEAERVRIDADRLRGEHECRSRILENRCRDKLSAELVKREKAVRLLDLEAGRLERGVRARTVANRDAERTAEAPARAADQAEQARSFKEETTQQRADIARRQAEHDSMVKEGPSRAELELARRAQRDAAKARSRTEQAEAAARRAQAAREDAARYEQKRQKHDAHVAGKPAGEVLPPLVEQGADAKAAGPLPPPPPPAAGGAPASDALPPPPPPPAN